MSTKQYAAGFGDIQDDHAVRVGLWRIFVSACEPMTNDGLLTGSTRMTMKFESRNTKDKDESPELGQSPKKLTEQTLRENRYQ